MRTSTISGLDKRPSPWQVGQTLRKPALAVAARAGEAELHGARHLRDVAGPIALRTNGGRAAHRAAAVAGLADFLARNVEPHLRPADGLPEIDVQPVFEIGAFFRTPAGCSPPRRLPKNWLKMSRKAPVPPPGCVVGALMIRVIGKIEAAKAHARLACARPWSAARTARRNVVGIEAVLIVYLALLRIAQDVVGFLDFLEPLFGGFIAGIQVGMILARQLAIRLANLVFFGVARHAEGFVVIVFAGGWHNNSRWLVVGG